ncbi:MAG: hypothetical protein PHO66_04980 [Eubacteriales bacterium]|nr:hypothetical protein [Eubacteriales bacterium]
MRVCDDGPADMDLSIAAFSQLITGYIDLAQAAYRADVAIHAQADALSRLFVRKTVMLADHF